MNPETTSLKTLDEMLQERIDELLLIEERAERRAEDLLVHHQAAQAEGKVWQQDVVQKIATLDNAMANIHEASLRFGDYVQACGRYRDRTITLFLGTLVLSLLILVGSLGWSYYVNEQLADTKEELASLQVKLKGTPVIKNSEGKDYIRIKPDSEVHLGQGKKKLPGIYAEIEYARK